MTRLGYNVQRIENENAFAGHFKKANLAGSLFFAGNTSFEFMVRLANENPDALIVVRNWPDTDQHKQMTPQQWMDRYANQSFGGKLIIGASNECEWTTEFLTWTLELCKLAVKNRVRICIINLNSGHNTKSEWAQAHDILQLAVDNPTLIYVGLHEYAGGLITSGFVGGDPTGIYNGQRIHPDYTKIENWPNSEDLRNTTQWHCGRFRWLEQYCQDTFGKLPSVILTEHGFDHLGDIGDWLNTLPRSINSINGWRTLTQYWKHLFPSMTAEQALWFQLKYAEEVIYADSCVKARFIFDYGPNPDWTPYRVDNVLEPFLESYAMVNVPISNEIFPRDVKLSIPGGGNLNIRPDASTVNPAIGSVPSGSIVTILSKYLLSGKNWCKINFNGRVGYISMLTNASGVDGVTLVDVLPPPVVNPPAPPVIDPTPIPPIVVPPPETNMDAVRQDLASAISNLQSVYKLLFP